MAARHPAKSKAVNPIMTFTQTLNYISQHGDGIMSLDVFFQRDIAGLVKQVNGGDPYARQCFATVCSTLAHIDAMDGHPTNSQQCAACCIPLTDAPACIVVAQTNLARIVPAIGFAICFKCGPDQARALEAAGKALRTFWPDGEIKTITHPEGGHA